MSKVPKNYAVLLVFLSAGSSVMTACQETPELGLESGGSTEQGFNAGNCHDAQKLAADTARTVIRAFDEETPKLPYLQRHFNLENVQRMVCSANLETTFGAANEVAKNNGYTGMFQIEPGTARSFCGSARITSNIENTKCALKVLFSGVKGDGRWSKWPSTNAKCLSAAQPLRQCFNATVAKVFAQETCGLSVKAEIVSDQVSIGVMRQKSCGVRNASVEFLNASGRSMGPAKNVPLHADGLPLIGNVELSNVDPDWSLIRVILFDPNGQEVFRTNPSLKRSAMAVRTEDPLTSEAPSAAVQPPLN